MRKHTGEQPYGCPFNACEERFTLKTGLQTHLKIHEALMGQRSLCLHSACRKTFKNDDELRSHVYVSCPGLVEECAALRAHLAQVVTQYDGAQISGAGLAALQVVVERSRGLLQGLPPDYLIRREDIVDSCRLTVNNCSVDGLDTCNNYALSPEETASKMVAAWRLHKDAAAEIASTTAATKAACAETAAASTDSGMSLLMAATEELKKERAAEIDQAAHPPLVSLDMESRVSGVKRRTFQDVYMEKFFRTDTSSGIGGANQDAIGYI
jgi:hypothetical protein